MTKRMELRQKAKKSSREFDYFNILLKLMTTPIEQLFEWFANRFVIVPKDKIALLRRQIFDGILIKKNWE